MRRKRLLTLSVGIMALVLVAALCQGPASAQKLRFSAPAENLPLYVLPVMAAEEMGFWRQQGIDVEWVAISGGPLFRAVAAGSVLMGMSGSLSAAQARARGVPAIIVADMQSLEPFFIYVKADSPIRMSKDFKGARVGVSSFGGTSHAMARMAAKALGLEGDIRFVAVGGAVNSVAMLKAGAIDATVQSNFPVAILKARGEVREVVSIQEFLPREWPTAVLYSHRTLAKNQPEVVRKVIKAILQSATFVRENRSWTIEKLKSPAFGFPDEVARWAYEEALRYGKDGKINRKGIENVINFLVEYGIISKGEAPPVDELFTNEFLG